MRVKHKYDIESHLRILWTRRLCIPSLRCSLEHLLLVYFDKARLNVFSLFHCFLEHLIQNNLGMKNEDGLATNVTGVGCVKGAAPTSSFPLLNSFLSALQGVQEKLIFFQNIP